MTVEEMLRQNEGWRNSVYKDSLGIPTIGCGFNLTRPDASEKIQALGLDYNQVLNGTQALTDEEVESLLSQDITDVVVDLDKIFFDINTLPINVVLVLQDLRFNVGPNRFRGFVHFIAAIQAGNWTEAANQLINSSWYTQVGVRAQKDVALLRSC